MTGTRTYEAIDATFVLLVNDAQYRYLADKNGKPFSYFLNPAAYGGGVARVRWDESSKKWMFENGSDTNDSGDTPPASFSYLDDRYTLGAGYGANNLLLSGDQTVTQGYKAPLGVAVPASEINFDNSGNVVIPGFDSVSLSPTYESAEIRPVLILKVYETRLASYEYYAYLGEFESESNGRQATDFVQAYLDNDKATFISSLLTQWYYRLTNTLTGDDAHLNYDLSNFYGTDAFDAWLNTMSIDAGERVISLGNLSYVDGWTIKGEKAEEMSSGHMMKPHVLLPGLTLVVGNEYFGLKNMRGVYTIFQRPEQFDYLAKVVETTVDNLVTSVAGDYTDNEEAAIKLALKEKLNVHWYDYFRGSESKVTIPVAWDEVTKLPTEWKEVTVNVFVGINTQGNLSGMVSYYDDGEPNNVKVAVNGMGVNLGDVFSYYTGAQDKSQPFPTAYGYVTGPYGSQVLVDNETGKKIGYKSDAYSL